MKELGKIKDACIVIAGQSPKGSSYNENGEGLEFHQGKKAFGVSIIEHSNVWTTEITKIAEPGDILMSVRAPVGPTNITDRKICIGRGLAAIRCNRDIIPQYILYALRNIESKIIGNDGAVFNSINKKQIEDLPLPILSLSEQQSIVDYLDSAFAKIDTMKANAEKALNEAKALFQASLKEMLEPKEGWEEKTLKETTSYRRGSFPQPYGNKEWYDGEGSMPFVQVAELQEDSFNMIPITKRRISKKAQPLSVFVPAGTVLVSLQGSIGKVSISDYDSYVDRTIAIFQDYKIRIDKTFFAYQLKIRFEIERLKARGTTIKTITKEEFANFIINYPSLSEQQSIVTTLDSLKSKV
ncbi:MAG: restriction endonuclease subunit S, partial [Prevotella sp.]|nr:restriction endonuclease subunit S [Prevotella sp.]